MDDIFSKIPEVLTILPDNTFYHKHPNYYIVWSLLHALYNFGMAAVGIIYGVIKIVDGEYTSKEMSFEIMTLVKGTIYASIVSLSVLYQNVFYPEAYLEMKDNFREIDAVLRRRGFQMETRWTSLKYFIFYLGYIFYVVYIYHINDCRSTDVESIIHTVLLSWVHFNFILEIILAWKWLEMIRQRIRCLNILMKQLEDTPLSFDLDGEPKNIRMYLLDLINVQKRIVKIVNCFNLLMGVSVALRGLLFIIEALVVVLIIAQNLETGIVLAIIDCIIDAFGWCVFVIKSQHVIDEGQESIDASLDANSSWLLRNNQSESDKELLAHLIQRIASQLPDFTAARFYPVNFAAFFMIINMTTGYMVIVVQFATQN